MGKIAKSHLLTAMSSPSHTPSPEYNSQNLFPYAANFPNYMHLLVQQPVVHATTLVWGIKLFTSNIKGTTPEAIEERWWLHHQTWYIFARDGQAAEGNPNIPLEPSWEKSSSLTTKTPGISSTLKYKTLDWHSPHQPVPSSLRITYESCPTLISFFSQGPWPPIQPT